mgnify:CR=1 FL=1
MLLVVSDFKQPKAAVLQYVRRLGKAGVKCICYNFMPVFDWLRTNLHTEAEDGSNAVEKKADGTYGNPVKEPETTEPAPETTEPGSSTETGDSFVIFAAIAAISVLGVALVAKKREN